MKSELLAALLPLDQSGEWSPADWRAYFDERTAIREHEGRLSSTEAAHLAFEDTITHWLCLNPPPPSEPAHGCVHCTTRDGSNHLLPVLTQGGHVWVHERCHAAWLVKRRGAARAFLAKTGFEGG